jgi:hypothetical protein
MLAKTPKAPRRGRNIKHYLMTVEMFFGGPGLHVHGYLMCDNKKAVAIALDRLVEQAEKLLNRPVPMCVLQTELTTGSDIVRDFLRKMMSDTTNLDNATRYHFCAWTMPTDHPDDAKLMALH